MISDRTLVCYIIANIAGKLKLETFSSQFQHNSVCVREKDSSAAGLITSLRWFISLHSDHLGLPKASHPADVRTDPSGVNNSIAVSVEGVEYECGA